MNDLVCPACRDSDGAAALAEAAGGLACTRCGASYPIRGGVPVVARDPAAILADASGAGDEVWPYLDVEEWCKDLAEVDPTSAEFRETWLLGVYAGSDDGELRECLKEWLGRHDAPPGDALEVGSGLGLLSDVWLGAVSGTVTHLELRLGLARLANLRAAGADPKVPFRDVGRKFLPRGLGHRWIPRLSPAEGRRVRVVAGDALDPPFRAGSFSLVAALNVLDTVRDPILLLAQLDALLAPGGLLVLGQPFHLEPHAQDPEKWIEGIEDLGPVLSFAFSEPYEFLEVDDMVEWIVPSHSRLRHHYEMHVLLARKPGGP